MELFKFGENTKRMKASAAMVFAACVLSLFLFSIAAAESPPPEIRDLTNRERAAIASLLHGELSGPVSQLEFLEGQGPDRRLVSISFLPMSGFVQINLTADFIQSGYNYIDPLFDEQMKAIASQAYDAIEGLLSPSTGIRLLFGGKPLSYYFPDEYPDDSNEGAQFVPPSTADVLVSAGHGSYFNYGDNQWKFQRDPSNGIVEDLLTPSFATLLSNRLIERSGLVPFQPRSTSGDIYQPSGLPFWQMAARYYLENILPNEPAIWNSNPSTVGPRREYAQDIRSRPLMANRLGVDAAIYLHSDAGPPQARGTRVYVDLRRRPGSIALGESVLCYMRELIQAQQGYENFLVSDHVRFIDHGENRLSQMDAIIVEVAFHTNPDDAVALTDPTFQSAAMKGVEKGYRLDRAGEDCVHFEITDLPDVAAPWDDVVAVEVSYEGFPQFPVDIEVELLDCPPGFTCTPGVATIEDPTVSPLTYLLACNGPPGSPVVTARWGTTLIDDDGVKTEQEEHTLTCGGAQFGSSSSNNADAPLIGYIEAD